MQLFSVSYVPPEWKHAIITPVFKNGLASSTANYRPISLTCVTSKISERIISNQMFSYFLANGLINKAQHGFLKGLSTATNLLQCVNDRSLSIQNYRGITVVHIDLAKAFDTVSHEKYRLKYSGIDGNLLSWLRNFLVGRTHCTHVGNCMSDTCDLRSDVIQGSTIGPLLFISFINELADLLGPMFVTSKLFADDLKVYAEVLTTVDRDCMMKLFAEILY